jgi:hypothetical protein
VSNPNRTLQQSDLNEPMILVYVVCVLLHKRFVEVDASVSLEMSSDVMYLHFVITWDVETGEDDDCSFRELASGDCVDLITNHRTAEL